MIRIATLYRFTRLDDPAALRAPLRALCAGLGVRGSLLLAAEGINGTIAGPAAAVERVLSHLREIPGCADLDPIESEAAKMPFDRLKVRLKREIVTMGVPGLDPTARSGRLVAPEGWNDLLSDPDVAVIDTRNAYETAIGSFRGAVDPGLASFGDFPGWWQANRDRFAGRRIAMFCTGGIRCEKSTSYLLDRGVGEVFHLRGGILNYLDTVPEAESLWQGQCYVFDRRVSVGHGLRPGPLRLCHACGDPLPPGAKADARFEPGVACPRCADRYSEADRARFRERERQRRIALARPQPAS